MTSERYSRSVQPDKIIKQTYGSLQFRRGMMITCIITILLLTGGDIFSLLVQGSIHDNTISIELCANKSSVSDDLNNFIEKLRGMEKLRIHIVASLARCISEPRELAGEPIDC